MTLLQVKALDQAMESADRRRQDAEARFARTPGGRASYPLSAPPRHYAWRPVAGGARELVARTDRHGPVALYRVVDRGASVEAEALPPASADVASPNMAGRALDVLRLGLARSRDGELTTSDQAIVLEEAIETAALLLLDPDTIDRQEKIAAFVKREQVRTANHVDMCDWAYSGGGPGPGKRA